MNFSDNTDSVCMSSFLFWCSQYVNYCVLMFSRQRGRPQIKEGMNSFPFLVEREAGCGSGSVFQSHPRWMLINLHRLFFFFFQEANLLFTIAECHLVDMESFSSYSGAGLELRASRPPDAWIPVIQNKLTSTTPLVTNVPSNYRTRIVSACDRRQLAFPESHYQDQRKHAIS